MEEQDSMQEEGNADGRDKDGHDPVIAQDQEESENDKSLSSCKRDREEFFDDIIDNLPLASRKMAKKTQKEKEKDEDGEVLKPSPLKCDVCFTSFNDTNRKPRNLICGHVYCSVCINQSILLGSKFCPACHTSFEADLVSDLPVNLYILKFVEDHSKDVTEQNSDPDDDFHAGICSKHTSSKLYFICKMHNVQMCRKCRMIHYQPDICEVITYQDYLKEKKSDLIVKANTDIYHSEENYHDMQYYVKKKDHELEKKSDQIKFLQHNLENETKKIEEAKKKIVEIEEIQTTLESLKTELSSAKKKCGITTSCENMKEKLTASKILEDTTDHFFVFSESLLKERPKRFLRIFQKESKKVYAYYKSGYIYRLTELSFTNGKIHLNALRKMDGQLPHNSVIVKVSHLLDLATPLWNVSSTEIKELQLADKEERPEVFLSFASNGNILGTVYISVDLNAPHAKQFLDLFIGHKGSSYKGLNTFKSLSNKGITYGISSNSYMLKNNLEVKINEDSSSEASLSTMHYYTDKNQDKYRPEAKFQFKITEFSKFKYSLYGPPCYVRNLPWKILVKSSNSQTKGQKPVRFLEFFLHCDGESKAISWSCTAEVELRLLSIRDGQGPFTKKFRFLFNNKESNRGCPDFIAWNDVLNTKKGFIKEDTITLEVWLSADVPKLEGIGLSNKDPINYLGPENCTGYKKPSVTVEYEAHLYMCVQVILENAFSGHQGYDLYNPSKVNYHSFKVKKKITLQKFLEEVADTLNYPIEQIRTWPILSRPNQTNRPTSLDLITELHRPLIEVSDGSNIWSVFIEIILANSGLEVLPSCDMDSTVSDDSNSLSESTEMFDVLLFFKYYDHWHKCLYYCGHHNVDSSTKVQDLVPILNKRAGLPQGTKLVLFEEVNPNHLVQLSNLNESLEYVIDELMDGDIIVFQCTDLLNESNFELPLYSDYYIDIFNRMVVTFCNKTKSSDPGFTMELSHKMNYFQMARAVAQRLGTDPYLLQFFIKRDQNGSGKPVRSSYKGTLKDMMPRQKKKIYYQQLSMKINEFESKKQFKCQWLGSGMKEEQELVIYTNVNGTVADLLNEAIKKVTLSEKGSAKLRLMLISSCKIVYVLEESIILHTLSTLGKYSYRLEEIPLEQIQTEEDELIIPVAHFRNTIFSTYGIPFLMKIKEGELFSHIKDRIQKKLDVRDKEFEIYQLAIVTDSKPIFILGDVPVNLSDLEIDPVKSHAKQPWSWIGIEHKNKTRHYKNKQISQNTLTMVKDTVRDTVMDINGLIQNINKKGEVCHYGNNGFAILYEDPPQDCEEKYSVLGYVTSGLEIISNIAENIAIFNQKQISPLFNPATVNDVGIVIES